MMFSMYWYSRWGGGGLAVAEQLINVLNISIPFHHVPRSLNSPSPPLVLSLCHSLSFSKTIWGNLHPLPHFPYKVNLKVCKVVLLCVSTSCGHCVLNQRKITDAAKTDDRILASSVRKRLSHGETLSFNYTMLIFGKKAICLSSIYRLMMSNHWKRISGLLI